MFDKIGEKILFKLSKSYELLSQEPDFSIDSALSNLRSAFGSNFLNDILNKNILDFGCGAGRQVVAIALKGAKFVVGVDIREDLLKKAVKLAIKYKVYDKVKFVTKIDENFPTSFDLIISHNSFEHYRNPEHIIELWKCLLKPNGKIYITFGPPWYAPYGAHMDFFTKVPWVNIMFSEKTVMKVRSYFRQDGAVRYEDVEGGLNKMTVKRFEKIIRNSGLDIKYLNYRSVKNIKILSKIPGIRELFINRVDCILQKRF